MYAAVKVRRDFAVISAVDRDRPRSGGDPIVVFHSVVIPEVRALPIQNLMAGCEIISKYNLYQTRLYADTAYLSPRY